MSGESLRLQARSLPSLTRRVNVDSDCTHGYGPGAPSVPPQLLSTRIHPAARRTHHPARLCPPPAHPLHGAIKDAPLLPPPKEGWYDQTPVTRDGATEHQTVGSATDGTAAPDLVRVPAQHGLQEVVVRGAVGGGPWTGAGTWNRAPAVHTRVHAQTPAFLLCVPDRRQMSGPGHIVQAGGERA